MLRRITYNIHTAFARFALLFFAASSLWGCEQVIDIDIPEHTPRLVVNGFFQPDSLWRVRITRSQHIQDGDEVRTVSTATVHVYQNGVVVDTLGYTTDGVYESVSGGTPVAGQAYEIVASAPGFEEVRGTDAVPTPVQIVDLTWTDSVSGVNGFSDFEYGEARFDLSDPAGVENFYFLQAYSIFIDTLSYPGDTLIYTFPINEAFTDESLQATLVEGGYIFSDAAFEGQTREIPL
ncbi:MAG: DUF4249 domain-containing protein, partial [Bacteroidota bacterium]